MRSSYVFTILLLWNSCAFGVDDCSPVDLSAGLGPVWNQSNTEWCHIVTATDCETRHMLNLGLLKPGERLHPLSYAIHQALSGNESVLGSTQNQGNVASDLVQQGEGPSSGLHDCKESELKAGNERANILNVNWQRASRDIKSSSEERAYWEKFLKQNCHTDTPAGTFHYWFQKDRVKEVASGKAPSPNSKFDKEVEGKINEAFEHKELAAIAYDSSFLERPRPTGAESHWSSIVGRKPGPGGKCYYVVRNSWGGGCKNYDTAVVSCKDGYLTIPADLLLRQIHTVQYLGGVSTKPRELDPADLAPAAQ